MNTMIFNSPSALSFTPGATFAAAFAAALGIALSAATPAAFAQGFDAVRLSSAAPGQDGGTVGLAVIAGRAYQGSDRSRTLLLPIVNYQWGNGWFAGITNGIGYNFSKSPELQYGLRMTVEMGRDENRAQALRGMGDLDTSAEGGAFFNYALAPGLFLTSSLRYGSGTGHKGLLVDLGATHSTAIAAQWRLSTGVGITLANADYQQSYFGVSRAQSAASGYAVYSPGSGVRDVAAKAALTYSVDRRTSVTAALSVSSLLGDAKDSPLTRKRTSGTGALVAAYAF